MNEAKKVKFLNPMEDLEENRIFDEVWTKTENSKYYPLNSALKEVEQFAKFPV